MKKKLFFLTAILFTSSFLKAQTITKQEKGYFNLTELGYSFGGYSFEDQVSSNKFVGYEDGAYSLSLRNINF